MKVLVIGSGMVGAEIARDLARDEEFEVTALDNNERALAKLAAVERIKTVLGDVGNTAFLKDVLSGQDIVVSAVPGFLGFRTLKTVIETGKNIVDISFMPEDAQELDALAKERGVIAISDCGFAPGLSHILVGHAVSQLDEVRSVQIYVGGLPKEPKPPWFHSALYSPSDLLEMYTRPARIIQNGKLITTDPLSEVEAVEFQDVGILEAFHTDGLRSLLRKVKADEMSEKTLRYPGHLEKMRLLKDLGMFSTQQVKVAGVSIRPVEFLASLLADVWRTEDGEEDISLLRVNVEGKVGLKRKAISFELIDMCDRNMKVTSMARVTGYTATSAVRLICGGVFSELGVFPPEALGMDANCFSAIWEMLERRSISIKVS